MKPYYEDEWATIYHADCLDVTRVGMRSVWIVMRTPWGIQRWRWSVECDNGAVLTGWAITRRGAERAAGRAKQDYEAELWEAQKQRTRQRGTA